MTIKVSVSVTTYNQEKYIKQTLDSILMQQTDFDYEILINDDASSDQSTAIIEKYKQTYPDKIKPIYQTENQYTQGKEVHYTFNYTRAQGKYIAYCDGDDYWTDPTKLQKQFDFMELHPEVSAYLHAGKSVNEQGTRILGTQSAHETNCYLKTEQVIGLQGMFASNSLFMRNYYNNDFKMPDWFNEAKITDYPLYLFLTTKGDIYYDNTVMCAFRLASEGSWTQQVYKVPEQRIKHIADMINLLNAFDRFTNYEYTTFIQSQINKNKFDCLKIDKGLRKKDPKEFNQVYTLLSSKQKIKINANHYLPSIVTIYRVMRDNRVIRTFKPREIFVAEE